MQLNCRAWLISGILIASLSMAGCGEKNAQALIPQAPPEVAIVVVKPERIAITSELPGRTTPYLIAEVRPQVSGIIQKRLFEEGSDVKAGEALYRIDPAAYQAAHASAKAALAKAEAVLSTARSKAARYKELVPINAVSRQDYEDMVGLTHQAEADVASCRAALETARINLDYTRVTSPISGRVGRSAVTIGALVTANQNAALCTVQQLDPIHVDVTQSSIELLQLKRNLASGRLKGNGVKEARVKLLLEDGTPYPLEGVLKFSDVTVDQSTGSITLRAFFPNPERLLLPGMYVRAILEQGVDEGAILVPQQGVTRDPKGKATALVVAGDERAERRTIRIARAFGDRWMVAEGLSPGDRLIVEGFQKVKPGGRVKAVPVGAKAASPDAGR